MVKLSHCMGEIAVYKGVIKRLLRRVSFHTQECYAGENNNEINQHHYRSSAGS